jgi:arylsulfatase A-like enzyme
VEISFATDCGPENNSDFDWAHWGDPTLNVEGEPDVRLLRLLDTASVWTQKVELVKEDLFLIGEDLRQVISAHPDSVVLFRGVRVPRGARLETAIGINQIAWKDISRGVAFEIVVRTPGGRETRVFADRLHPARIAGDRCWREVLVSMDEFADCRVDISFRTTADPGPQREPMWSGWSQPRLTLPRAPGARRNLPTAPNVILLTLDTVRADHLGSYGAASARTPNLDWLAEQGTVFERCFSQSNITLPSHLAILSSRYPSQHTRDNTPYSLASSLETLGDLLRERDFDTSSVVSAEILNPAWCRGIDRGFSQYRGVQGVRRLGSHTLSLFQEWLDRRPPGPFFSWVHWFDAHAPYIPPRSHYGMFFPQDGTAVSPRRLVLPKELEHYRRWTDAFADLRLPLAQYDASIAYLDSVLGDLLKDLDRRGMLEQTIIAVTADHGECLGERDVYFAHVGLHDVVTHVPLILYAPGRLRGGQRSSAMAMSIDILPTLFALLELAPSAGAQGRNLLSSLGAGSGAEDAVFAEHSRDAQMMVRTSRFKYLRSTADLAYTSKFSFRSGAEELYDLESDPGETRNLAIREPGLLDEFRARLTAWERENRDGTGHGHTLQADAEVAERLRSLGYF